MDLYPKCQLINERKFKNLKIVRWKNPIKLIWYIHIEQGINI